MVGPLRWRRAAPHSARARTAPDQILPSVNRRTLLSELVIVMFMTAVALAGGAPHAFAQPEPTMRIESQIGAGGPVMMVVLEGWPMGAVSITVCGADARRASRDCDNRGAQVAVIQQAGTGAARLPALTPPSDCPCVVRAATADSAAVKTTPVVVPGRRVMTPAEMPPDPNAVPSPDVLEISSALEGGESLADKLAPAFGAPADHTLVLTLKNVGTAPLDNLNASARVGSQGANGSPLALPAIAPLGVQETRTYRMPVGVPALTFGSYTVSGKVSGLASPATFRAETSTRPTGLAALVAATVIVWVLIKWRRRRIRPNGGRVSTVDGDNRAPPKGLTTAAEVAKL